MESPLPVCISQRVKEKAARLQMQKLKKKVSFIFFALRRRVYAHVSLPSNQTAATRCSVRDASQEERWKEEGREGQGRQERASSSD